jgi:hypothetical protein
LDYRQRLEIPVLLLPYLREQPDPFSGSDENGSQCQGHHKDFHEGRGSNQIIEPVLNGADESSTNGGCPQGLKIRAPMIKALEHLGQQVRRDRRFYCAGVQVSSGS